MVLDAEDIEKLRYLIGKEKVLIDEEDLYVYSFYGPLGMRRGHRPDVVVRVDSEREAEYVFKTLGDKAKIIYVWEEVEPAWKEPLVVLEPRNPLGFKDLKDGLKVLRKKRIEEKPKVNVGNWRSALEDRLVNRILYTCKRCSSSEGASCRGFCTVAPFIDLGEAWSSRGRLLISRGLFEGELKASEKIMKILFTCTSCAQCYAQCGLDGIEISRAIVAARRKLAEQGFIPDGVKKILRNVLRFGNPYGLPAEDRVWWMEDLTNPPKQKAQVLYWAGCTVSYRLPEVALSTMEVLDRAGVEFTVLGEEEGCCGLILYLFGFWDEAKKNALKVTETIRRTGAKTLVTGCAGCYYTFRRVFPEVLGVSLPLRVLHLSQFLEGLLPELSPELHGLSLKVTYHDPCDLGRHCGVYEPPRRLIKAVPGVELVEMELNREHGRCCGGGGGLWALDTELAVKIAKSELVEEVSPLGVDAVVTACPLCYTNLRYASELGKVGVKVYDLAELLGRSMGV